MAAVGNLQDVGGNPRRALLILDRFLAAPLILFSFSLHASGSRAEENIHSSTQYRTKGLLHS